MKLQNKLIFLLLFGFILIASGCISGIGKSADVEHTQNPSDIVLTTSDMPFGWEKDAGDNIEGVKADGGEKASSSFWRLRAVITCEVTKYPSIEDAKSEYQRMYNAALSTESVQHNDIGQESYSTRDVAEELDTTVFREGNFIVEVQGLANYESSHFARIIEGKLNH